MYLITELGGTYARFALCHSLSNPAPERISVMPCSRFSSIYEAIAWYMSEQSIRAVDNVCLAIAGPAKGPEYRLTNSTWSFDIDSVRQITGTKEIKVVNDFAALAAYVPHAADDELLNIRAGRSDDSGPRLVLGPGTGMGMAMLIPIGDDLRVFPSEGGNVGFSPATHLEIEILNVLHKSMGRVLVEDMLSGNGLVLLHKTLCAIRDTKPQSFSAVKITELALAQKDPVCKDTVNIFCGIMGEYAGDMVLATGASGGVYLGGGILPRIASMLASGTFCARFSAKRKVPEFVKDVPVWLITAKYPALIGACYLLREEH